MKGDTSRWPEFRGRVDESTLALRRRALGCAVETDRGEEARPWPYNPTLGSGEEEDEL